MARWQANLILLFTALIWGGTFTVQKISGDHIGVMWFNGIRFFIGAACILPFAYQEHRRLKNRTPHTPLKHWKLFLLTGFVLGTAAIIQHIGILETSIANAGFLTTLYVPLTPLLAITLFNRRPHWIIWPGVMGCLYGTYILSGGTLTSLGYGDIAVMLSAILWAFHILLIGKCMDASGTPFTMACIQFLGAALIGLISGASLENFTAIQWSEVWWGIIFTGVFAVATGFTLQVLAQKYTPPSDTAIMLSMEAVFAAIIGTYVLGEILTTHQITGCLVIFVSVLMVEIIPTSQKKRTNRQVT